MELAAAYGRDLTFGFVDHTHPSPRLHHPRLIVNDGRDTMLRTIRHELRRADSFVFSVAFVTSGAIAALKQALLDFPGRGTIITSTYLGFNSPAAFEELLNLRDIEVLLLDGTSEGFHAKGYVFRQQHSSTAIVGSSNLTESALLRNHEWNLRFSAMADGDIVHQLEAAVERQRARAVPLTRAWVDAYRRTWRPPSAPATPHPIVEGWPAVEVVANSMQVEALAEIDLVRSRGERRALVVSATGTGKTILAALDVRTAQPERMLFVVHREQILDKAIAEFRRVLGAPAGDFGKLAGGRHEIDRRYVFATVQSLTTNLARIAPDAFDYVLIDEVHRAGADGYRRVLDHLAPRFLLGITATPERTDGFNIFELFDYNVAYEIRLQKALEADMLAPFHYYGVTDYVTGDGEVIDDMTSLSRLVSTERVDHVLAAVERYGQAGVPVRGLVFCSRNEEAAQLAQILNQRTLRGRPLRTVALSGKDPVPVREEAVARLERGELDYLLTVDIFNEGIDIPAINQVVMLRQTQSAIVFTQQLGRGLRKAAGKDYLVVIDFIGNYANNYLVPVALFGDTSLSKDSVRQNLIEAEEAGSIAGLSSVNFDAVARDQVFRAIDRVRLDSMVALKAAYTEMRNRVGAEPRLLDFARFDTADPVVLATRESNYWQLLAKFAKLAPPTPRQGRLLNLLSLELLNGKRPHELLLLQALLERGKLTPDDIVSLLHAHHCTTAADVVRSAVSLLTLDFFPAKTRPGYLPLAVEADGVLTLGAELAAEWDHPTFRAHATDVIDTGLFLARHRHGWAQELRPGRRYSRKDACRLLGFRGDETSTLYGYKVDDFSGTCPIFVTYHKADDVESSVAYGDEFVDESTMRWFTRSRRTLRSNEVRRIVEHDVEPHLFVKRDDAEGSDYLYLGTVTAHNAHEETMPTGDRLPVVTMDLRLDQPVERGLYDYLTAAPIPAPERLDDRGGRSVVLDTSSTAHPETAQTGKVVP
ncbi:DUF3427 domain-containing protein [Tessaracoccus lubricantis]|uniref:DUF3427 domain-containing protein n=1 Tax=Tessaracoccus lubricantis TaxID=545543 RepID=A0ABP9F9X7_9ACTN